MLNPMTEQLLFSRQSMTLMRLSLYLLTVAALLGSSPSFISYANAQNGAVTVDLSVIQGGVFRGFGHVSRSGLLLIPPKSNPTSQLHVAPQNAPRLKTVTAKRNVKLTQTNSTQTKPAFPQPVKALAAPAPKPIPLKKVAKATPTPVPASNPVPAKQAEKTAAPAPKKVMSPAPPPPPPPKIATVPEPEASTEQASAKSQSIKIAPGQSIRIVFDEAATKLPDSVKDNLRKLADGVHDKKDLSLRLMAYADAEGLSASKARRLSLSRALSVRSFLIESGVKSTRIGVMALGRKTPDNPKNRVDISIAKR
jgi:outer membrane protein OmpA-like peptidoglycan-associated protein